MPSRRRSRITEWNGPQVVDRVLDATAAAIDTVTAAAVTQAKANVAYRGGRLRRHLKALPAIRTEIGNEVIGLWGVLDANREAFYAWLVEHGGSRSPAQPFLRPAADSSYLRLAAEIRRRLK